MQVVSKRLSIWFLIDFWLHWLFDLTTVSRYTRRAKSLGSLLNKSVSGKDQSNSAHRVVWRRRSQQFSFAWVSTPYENGCFMSQMSQWVMSQWVNESTGRISGFSYGQYKMQTADWVQKCRLSLKCRLTRKTAFLRQKRDNIRFCKLPIVTQ